MTAGIPYTPFPTIPLGGFELQTFGLCVAVGILLGGWLTARRNARLGIGVDQTERIVILLVVTGLIGSRVLFVLTTLDEWRALSGTDFWLYPFAVWNGGLQFSGGIIAALLLAPFITRRVAPAARWHLLDGAALGLTVGMAVGRLGCYAVGEHLGLRTTFPLAIRYEGGDTVEPQGEELTVQGPLVVGETYWSAALLEASWLVVVLVILLAVDRRGRLGAGALAGLFSVMYASARFATDFVRAYDERVLGLTGAQYMCLALFAAGVWFLLTSRRRESPVAYRARLAHEAADRVAGGAGFGDPDRAGDDTHDEALDGTGDDAGDAGGTPRPAGATAQGTGRGTAQGTGRGTAQGTARGTAQGTAQGAARGTAGEP